MSESKTISTKMKIVESAIELFKEQGYEEVTVADICERCGLTRGAFYYHFSTKGEVLDNYFLSTDSFTLKEIVPLIGSDDYLEQLYHVLNIYLDHSIDAGPEVVAQILKRGIDTGVSMLNPDEVSMRPIFISFIEKAQQIGQIRNTTPAPLLVDAIVYLGEGIALVWCGKNGQMDLKAEYRRVLDALFMR